MSLTAYHEFSKKRDAFRSLKQCEKKFSKFIPDHEEGKFSSKKIHGEEFWYNVILVDHIFSVNGEEVARTVEKRRDIVLGESWKNQNIAYCPCKRCNTWIRGDWEPVACVNNPNWEIIEEALLRKKQGKKSKYWIFIKYKLDEILFISLLLTMFLLGFKAVC